MSLQGTFSQPNSKNEEELPGLGPLPLSQHLWLDKCHQQVTAHNSVPGLGFSFLWDMGGSLSESAKSAQASWGLRLALSVAVPVLLVPPALWMKSLCLIVRQLGDGASVESWQSVVPSSTTPTPVRAHGKWGWRR